MIRMNEGMNEGINEGINECININRQLRYKRVVSIKLTLRHMSPKHVR